MTTYQPAVAAETTEKREAQVDWRGMLLALLLAPLWLPPLLLLGVCEVVVTTRMERWE